VFGSRRPYVRREYLRQFDSGAQKKARAWPFLGASGV
jgi:hypothetical protein